MKPLPKDTSLQLDDLLGLPVLQLRRYFEETCEALASICDVRPKTTGEINRLRMERRILEARIARINRARVLARKAKR
jgi:hypothetical protein